MSTNKPIGRFRDESHRSQRLLLLCYKFYRRRGCQRAEALQQGMAKYTRLTSMFTIMEASDWTADPIAVAKNAVLAGASL